MSAGPDYRDVQIAVLVDAVVDLSKRVQKLEGLAETQLQNDVYLARGFAAEMAEQFGQGES